MFSVSVETVINRPPAEVFTFIADAENDVRWCPAVKEIERVEGAEPGLGARYRMHHEPGGMSFRAMVETTAFEPNDRIEWLMTDKGHHLEIVYELEPVDGRAATRLRQTSHVQTRGWLRIPGFFLKGRIQKGMKEEMSGQFRNLKDLLEREENPRGTASPTPA